MSIFDASDFEHLKANQTAEYPLRLNLPRTNPEPVTLIVCFAGESNQGFAKARKSSAFRAAKGDAMERMWREAFAKHVIKGWKNVLRADGTAVPYTAAAGAELLQHIADAGERTDIINGLTLFCVNPDNFTAPLVDPGDLGNG